ncbi:hypothetical protein YDYSG_30190 [Paenibacillus tyrfis]|nr:hypothetical protein YDYSG_30190 [Paenibacillus tyrfis]GMX62256.1 hypothetical protein Elgi_20600 [Paenibacillus elgii]
MARGRLCVAKPSDADFAAQSLEGGCKMKFYTIKLPKFLGGFVKAVLNTFSKN